MSTWLLIIFSTGIFSQHLWAGQLGVKENRLPPIEIEIGEHVSAADARELENLKASMKKFVEAALSHPLLEKHSSVIARRPLSIRILENFPGGLFDDGVSELSAKCGDYKYSRKLSINIGVDRVLDRSWQNLLAHELFHYAHYLINPDEPRWLREGLALWFENAFTGNPPGNYLRSALLSIQTPLMADYEACDVKPAQYGHNFFLIHFLAKNCGGEETVAKLLEPSPLKGRAKFEKVLPVLVDVPAICRDFSKVVLTMELARAQNQIVYALPPSYLAAEAPKEIFRLWPASRIWSADEAISSNHLTLSLYEPLLLKVGEAVLVNDPRFEVFWLEQRSPFSIIRAQTKPSDEKYRQFIMRVR